MNRRNFVKLAGLGGVVFTSGLARGAGPYGPSQDEFFFVQPSDPHWGSQGPAVNPDAAGTLPKAIAAVNALETQPDFVVFTGDLTHTTDDPRERRRRLAEFRDLARGLKNPNVRFMPGEHDAALDDGAAYQELFGPTHYAFDHKGVQDRKSTRLNSSHGYISYAVFCLKKKNHETGHLSLCCRLAPPSSCIRE